VKQQIVEIPENEIAVAFVHAQAGAAFRIELEQNPAFQQQFEYFEAEGGGLAAESADLLWLRQRGEGADEGGIADPEQRTGARRFQHHLVVAPAQIGKAR
jgi:hypothetical protein